MRKTRRGNLKGWWRYALFLLLPFVVVFFEVWLRAGILKNEYEKHGLRNEVRAIDARIDDLVDASHELARMERVFEHAPDLGLVPPAPGHVVEIADDDRARSDFALSNDAPRVVGLDGD